MILNKVPNSEFNDFEDGKKEGRRELAEQILEKIEEEKNETRENESEGTKLCNIMINGTIETVKIIIKELVKE